MHTFNLRRVTILHAGTPMTRPRSTGLVTETGTHLGRNSSARYKICDKKHTCGLALTSAGNAARKVTDLTFALLLQAIKKTGQPLWRGRSQGIENPPHTIPNRMIHTRNPGFLVH